MIGYQFDWYVIQDLQTAERYAGGQLQEGERQRLYDEIIREVDRQFESCKKTFTAASACNKCNQSPLVTGSVHENFTNPITQKIWDDLNENVDGKQSIFHWFSYFTLDNQLLIVLF